MRRFIAIASAAIITLATAAPASAAVAKVNAAKKAVAWDDVDIDDGAHWARCTVYVLDWLDDPYVRLWCIGDRGDGRAWVRVRVPGVRGDVTRVRVSATGDCNRKEVRWRKRRSTVLVTVSVTAEANCEVRTVRVRHT
jgi:hypothetical protein